MVPVLSLLFPSCPRSVNSGRSAVCVFNLEDIKAAFAGNYKVLNRDTLRWSTRVQEKVANPGSVSLLHDYLPTVDV